MARYRPYSRRVLRRRIRAWLKRYANVVLLSVLVTGLLIALEAGLLLGLGRPGPAQWFLLGLISAVLAASLAGGLGAMFLITDEEAVRQIRGAWGEENTREELKRARRRQTIWGWVDSLTVESGDVDHIVISRAGGLVAIDSKWRTKVDVQGRDAMVRQARDARQRAETAVRTVLDRNRRGRRADGGAIRVRTVVVLWGSAQSTLPRDTHIDGVDFIRGRDLNPWLDRLDGDAVDQAPAEELLASLKEYRERAWAAVVDKTPG